MSSGYDAAGDSHIVKIGPYLLVALSANTYEYYDVYGEVEDTLNSEVQEISEYFTPTNFDYSHSGERYVHFRENIRTLDTDDYEYSMSNCVNKWYFVVLDYDKLPENYELKYTIHEDANGDDRIKEFVLTYEDIQYKLSKD